MNSWQKLAKDCNVTGYDDAKRNLKYQELVKVRFVIFNLLAFEILWLFEDNMDTKVSYYLLIIQILYCNSIYSTSDMKADVKNVYWPKNKPLTKNLQF